MKAETDTIETKLAQEGMIPMTVWAKKDERIESRFSIDPPSLRGARTRIAFLEHCTQEAQHICSLDGRKAKLVEYGDLCAVFVNDVGKVVSK